jgi:hypothetical protein
MAFLYEKELISTLIIVTNRRWIDQPKKMSNFKKTERVLVDSYVIEKLIFCTIFRVQTGIR